MIGLENNDSSFFDIRFKDKTQIKVLTQDVISFQYNEEMNKISSGSVQLHDPKNIYSRILRQGRVLDIRFGYKRPDLSIESLFSKKENKNEISGVLERKGIKASIQSPSGSLSGTIKYNMNFYASEFLDGRKNKVYRKGTKKTVIEEVFDEMGIVETYIKFDRQIEQITPDTYVMQHESNFRFLMRIAMEWRALFRISTNSKGQKIAFFANPKYVDKLKFAERAVGASSGNSLFVDYKDSLCNVIDATWQNHVGQSGQGDNVQIKMVNGKPVHTRFIAKGEKIQAWRLDAAKIDSELRKRGSFTSKAKLMKEWLNNNDFNKLVKEGFFYLVNEVSAPQGLGYSCNLKMLGNPMATTPLKIIFGKGFPDFFAHNDLTYYARKVTHTIDRKGYMCDLDIADTFTITGGIA